MDRKIKALGLAFAAIAAIGAAAASATQAGSFDVGKQPAVITGHSEPVPGQQKFQEHVLQVQRTGGGGIPFTLPCQTASFEGTTSGLINNTEATVTATYGTGQQASDPQGCLYMGQKVQTLMNGCKYTLTGAAHAANTATVDIVGCTAGKQIEVKNSACPLKIGEQNSLSHVVATQISPQELTVQATVAGLKVQQSGGFLCLDGIVPHTGTNATFTGNTIVKAYADSGNQQVTKHGHQYEAMIEGAQTTIQST